MQIAGTILAGGRTKRLGGIAKGNLTIKGRTIIARIKQEVIKTGIEKIVISTNETDGYNDYNLPLIADLHHNIGPIAGIISSVQFFSSTHDAVLFCPCDMPTISDQEFAQLLNAYSEEPGNIIYAKTAANNHPLCVIIPTIKLNAILAHTTKGQHKIMQIWNHLAATPLLFNDETAFLNLNTPADLYGIVSKY